MAHVQNFLPENCLKSWLEENGEKPYRQKQIWQGVFRDLHTSFSGITTLSESLRARLEKEVWFPCLEAVSEEKSGDGQVIKALLRLKDNLETETVLLNHIGKRTTVCVSTMTGCPLGCRFCATGSLGAGSSLTADEIVAQVLHFERRLKKGLLETGGGSGSSSRPGQAIFAKQKFPDDAEMMDHSGNSGGVTNVVLMGMGEPFLNYDNVILALDLLKDPQALGLAARHLTVSTAGVVPGILRFAEDEDQVCLAVSLHAPNQKLRVELMPVAERWPIDELMSALDHYTEKTNRRVFYEYIMLDKVNDLIEHAKELAALLRGRLAHVNLIRYNQAVGDFRPSSTLRVAKFQEVLKRSGVLSTVRASLGGDIKAACGQLKGKR